VDYGRVCNELETGEENYATSKETMLTTAAKCEVKVDREPLSAVIDSGAATSIITKN